MISGAASRRVAAGQSRGRQLHLGKLLDHRRDRWASFAPDQLRSPPGCLHGIGFLQYETPSSLVGGFARY
jgi:hypothetical protein